MSPSSSAMATLIVHKPWQGSKPRTRNGDSEWIEEFLEFVQSDECPEMVKQEYARVKERAESKRPPEAVATEESYDWETTAEMDDAVKDLLNIISTQTTANDPFFDVNGVKIDRGLNYEWSKRVTVRKRNVWDILNFDFIKNREYSPLELWDVNLSFF